MLSRVRALGSTFGRKENDSLAGARAVLNIQRNWKRAIIAKKKITI